MRFGVVIFDDVFRKTAGARKRPSTNGWASIEGQPPKRIVSISELQSDVKWWTNFDFADFNAHLMGRHPNMFFSGFLRTELKSVAQELGCGVEQYSADRCAQVMSVVFARVMRMAVSTLGIKLDGGGIGTKTLCDFITGRTVNKHKIPDELNLALQHGYQAWTTVTQSLPKDWKSATLRRPRYSHAIEVLSAPVPGEHRWKYINSARMPAAAERIDWCVAHELPVLANVIVKPRRGDFTELISYNSGATLTRSWVCQPELLFLSQFCDIEVIGAFVCEAGFESQREIDQFPSLGEFSLASFSLGLLTENFWVALASPRTNMMGKKFYPPRSVWYRAMDRIALFVDAAKLRGEGFQITGYGTGSVLVCYPAGATEDLISVANSMGLDVPTFKYAEVRTEVRLNADE